MQVKETADNKTTIANTLAKEVVTTFENLAPTNIQTLRQIYTEDVCFEDPAHGIQGLETLISYFESLYQNLEDCQFKFHKEIASNEDLFLSWTMLIKHKKIRHGKVIRVEGASYLKTRAGKVFYHRDYFDLGAMVYENVPLLGGLIRFIRNRLGQ